MTDTTALVASILASLAELQKLETAVSAGAPRASEHLCAASLWLAFLRPLSLPCPQVGVALTSRGDAEAERRVRTGGPAECCQARAALSKNAGQTH